MLSPQLISHGYTALGIHLVAATLQTKCEILPFIEGKFTTGGKLLAVNSI